MNTLLQFNEQLNGAPFGVLIFFFVIGCGYVLKSLKRVPNNFIPFAVIVAATLLFMLGAPARGEISLRIWLVRNFLIGFTIGFLAWLAHRLVLKRIERKLGLFAGDDPGDTAVTHKDFLGGNAGEQKNKEP